MNYNKKYKKYLNKINLLNKKYNLDTEKINNTLGAGDNTKHIYFIRHGMTEWNKLGKLQGQESDTNLNEDGMTQSKNTGKYLANYRFNNKTVDCILCSPMTRCKETANIISKEVGFDKNKIIYLEDITEGKKGSFSGLTTKDDFLAKFNELMMDKIEKITDPVEKYKLGLPKCDYQFRNQVIEQSGMPIKDLDNYDNYISRVNSFIQYLNNTDCSNILVVSHSGYLETLLKTIFRLSRLPYGSMKNGKNCSICYCTLKNNQFTLISPQNTEHLSLY